MAFGCSLILIILIFVRPQDFVPGIVGLPLVNIIMILLLVSWLYKKAMSRDQKSTFLPAHYMMVLLWGVIVISTLAVHWITGTIATFFDWAKVVLMFFMVGEVLRSVSRIRIFIWCLVLSVGFTAFAGVMQYYGHDITGAGLFIENGIPRIRGVSIFDTNQLAYAVAFSLPLLLGILISSRNALARIFLFILSGLYLYCIYLTQSRGGMLCAALILPLSFMFIARKKLIKIIAVIFCAVVFVFAYTHSSRLSTTGDYKSDESAMGRVEVWADALAGIRQHPIFGFGKDQFTEHYARAPHNSYLQVVAELGLVGLYLWIALFYVSLKDLKNAAMGDWSDQLNIISKALQVSLFAYLFGSLFSSNAYYVTLYILFAITIAVCRTAYKQGSNLVRKRFSVKDAAVVAFCEVVILLSLRFFVKFSYN